MKKGTALVLGIIMTASLVACGNDKNVENPSKNNIEIQKDADIQKPEDAITDFFTKFKSCNFKGIKSDLITSDSIDLKAMEDYTDAEKKAIKYWLQKLSYEVLSSKVNGDTAVFTTKVSALDGNQIYSEYKENILAIKPNNQEELDGNEAKLADEKYSQALINALKSKDNEIVSTTVEINLKKEDGKWKIKLDNQLLTAMYGGLDSTKVNK